MHGSASHWGQTKISLESIIRRPRYALVNHLNVILLDTSASILTEAALQKSKAIVNALNRWVYLRRETLSLVSFGNDQVNMLIPPSRPRKSLITELGHVPAGGGTPFRAAVSYINHFLVHRQRRRPHESQSIIILTDGRGRGDVSDIHLPAKITLIDMESSKVRLRRCYHLAQQWDAEYLHVDMIPTE
ncbi:MAG: VWA domain-containing protein [Thiohalomonadales bacterium]